MKLFLHIGTEKTGTTTIQYSLASVRPMLKRFGILYPLSFGNENHEPFYAAASPFRVDEITGQLDVVTEARHGKYRALRRKEFETELKIERPQAVVISNEHLSARLLSVEDVQAVKDFVAGLFSEIKIAIYVRRQDDFLLSSYSTEIKTGGTHHFSALPYEEARGRYDYRDLIERWAAVFGQENIIVKKFASSEVSSHGLTSDFLLALGMPRIPVKEVGVKNPSLGWRALAALRQVNEMIPRTVNGKYNMNRGDIAKLLETLPDDPLVFGVQARRQFMAQFAESNDWVRQTFFPDGPGTLFDLSELDPRDGEQDDAIPEMSLDDLYRVLTHLWIIKQNQFLAMKVAAERK